MSTQRESTQPLLHHASPLRGGSGAPFLGRTLSLQREVLAKEERKCAALKLIGGVGGSTLLFFGTLFAFEGIGPTGRIWWMLMVMVGALLDLLVQLSAALQRLQRERELSRTILTAFQSSTAAGAGAEGGGGRLVPSAEEQLQILDQVQRQHAPGSRGSGGNNVALGVVVLVCGVVLLGFGIACQSNQQLIPYCPTDGQDRLAMVALGGCLVLLELAMAAFLTWESINAEAVSNRATSTQQLLNISSFVASPLTSERRK